jgi:hypothetical protein
MDGKPFWTAENKKIWGKYGTEYRSLFINILKSDVPVNETENYLFPAGT